MKASQVKLYESSCAVHHIHLLLAIGDLMLVQKFPFFPFYA